jgi:hypothetical protein
MTPNDVLANIHGVYDAIYGVFGLEAAKDMNEQTPTETLEQAMWHLFVHTAHDVCPDINEQDLETVLRSSPAIFDMAAGTVMRTIRLQMLSAEYHPPKLTQEDKDWADWALRAEPGPAIYRGIPLPADHHRPDRNHANEQRETDERRCFMGDCAQDGIAGVDGAETPEPGFHHLRAAMDYATTPAQPAAAIETNFPIESRWPGDSLNKTERT